MAKTDFQSLRSSLGLKKSQSPLWIATAVFAVIALGTLGVWKLAVRDRNETIRLATLAEAESVRAQLLQGLEDRLRSVERMADRMSVYTHLPAKAWRADAERSRRDLGVLEVQSFITADKRVKWIHPPNPKFIGYDLSKDEFRNHYLELARTKRSSVITPVTELKQGGRGFIVMVPSFDGHKLVGYISAAIRPSTFIKEVVKLGAYEMTFKADNEELFSNVSHNRPLRARWGMALPLNIHGQTWTIEIAPTAETLAQVATKIPTLILTFGTLMAFLLSLLTNLALVLRRQSALIREQRNFLDVVISASPIAILVLGNDHKIKVWNTACERMYGWTAEEAIGKILPFVPEDRREASNDLIHRILKSGEHVQTDAARVRKDGTPITIRISAMALRGPDGETHGLMAVMDDVTAQRTAEREIRTAHELAENAARAKSEFLANMSHEIRTPLNGIIGMSELLLDTGLQGEQRRYANIVQTSATTLLTLINDVLDLSKIEAGKMQMESLDFSLTALVESQSDILVGKAAEKKLTLVTYVSPNLPQTLRGDPGRLSQVLVNLIGNAIKFTPEGGVCVRVIESSSQPPTVGPVRIRFEVQDTGIGLTPTDVEKLFKPFTQVDGSTARKYGGTGLGLSIAKNLVEEMGGTIGVESQDGAGSTFWFELEFNAITLNHFLEAQSSRQKRILVVDPDPLALDVIRRYLTAWRLTGDCAQSVGAAINYLAVAKRYQPYEVVLVAQEAWTSELWNHHGAGVRQRILIQKFGRSIPAEFQGMTGVLHKPVKQSQLYDLLVGIQAVESVAPPQPIRPPPLASLSSAHILVADDVAANQLLALKYLEKLGYRSQAVGNGREVIEALQTGHYDLVLMDCQMPEMDGYEATRRIRQLDNPRLSRIPIIALTANALSGDEKMCLDAGMNDYLSKPFKRERLGELIEKWLTDAASKSKSALG